MSSIPSSISIQAVLFDLGGVWIHLRDWPASARQVPGLGPLRTAFDDAYIGRQALAFEAGEIGPEAFFDSLAAELGSSPADAQALWLARLDAPCIGTGELLDDLQVAGIDCGCLSNTNVSHWRELCARLPIHRLRWPLVSFEMGVMKPDPRIYADATALVGRPPASIAFFDDRLENIEAAAAYGWNAGWVDVRLPVPPAMQMRQFLADWGVAVPV